MKLSLGRKMILFIILVSVVLGITAICISNSVIRRMIDEKYTASADELAQTVAVALDTERVAAITNKVLDVYNRSDVKISNEEWEDPGYDAYIGQFSYLEEDEDFLAVREALRVLQDLNTVECMYIARVVPENEDMVYIVDAAYEDVCPPGSFDPVYEMNYESLVDPARGFPAYITNTPEYGWLLTAAAPIFDADGNVISYAALDISMNDIRAEQKRFVLTISALLGIITLFICILSIIFINRRIVKPINMLSEAAGQYGQNQNGRHQQFSSLKISTGDEIEILLGSMVQMERDIDNYIKNLTQAKEQLSNARQHADDMQKQAHYDSLTGIRNRTAYDKEIERLEEDFRNGSLTAFGIAMIDLNFLKVINDNYGHEYGNAAIVSLSKLICNVFVHSPVFRIGGDEFAVILRNNDYDRITDLQQEFNSRLEALQADDSLQPWEKLSAAFGYAVYDAQTDQGAETVFKRADHNMYERKKAMKAARQ